MIQNHILGTRIYFNIKNKHKTFDFSSKTNLINNVFYVLYRTMSTQRMSIQVKLCAMVYFDTFVQFMLLFVSVSYCLDFGGINPSN